MIKNMEDYKKSDYYKEITLEKVRFGLQHIVSKAILDSIELETEEFNMLIPDSIIFKLKGFLLGEELYDSYYDIPINWWEMFKETHFRGWLKKKFPVKYKRAFLNIKAVYPKLNIYLPKRENEFRYAINQWEEDL